MHRTLTRGGAPRRLSCALLFSARRKVAAPVAAALASSRARLPAMNCSSSPQLQEREWDSETVERCRKFEVDLQRRIGAHTQESAAEYIRSELVNNGQSVFEQDDYLMEKLLEEPLGMMTGQTEEKSSVDEGKLQVAAPTVVKHAADVIEGLYPWAYDRSSHRIDPVVAADVSRMMALFWIRLRDFLSTRKGSRGGSLPLSFIDPYNFFNPMRESGRMEELQDDERLLELQRSIRKIAHVDVDLQNFRSLKAREIVRGYPKQLEIPKLSTGALDVLNAPPSHIRSDYNAYRDQKELLDSAVREMLDEEDLNLIFSQSIIPGGSNAHVDPENPRKLGTVSSTARERFAFWCFGVLKAISPLVRALIDFRRTSNTRGFDDAIPRFLEGEAGVRNGQGAALRQNLLEDKEAIQHIFSSLSFLMSIEGVRGGSRQERTRLLALMTERLAEERLVSQEFSKRLQEHLQPFVDQSLNFLVFPLEDGWNAFNIGWAGIRVESQEPDSAAGEGGFPPSWRRTAAKWMLKHYLLEGESVGSIDALECIFEVSAEIENRLLNAKSAAVRAGKDADDVNSEARQALIQMLGDDVFVGALDLIERSTFESEVEYVVQSSHLVSTSPRGLMPFATPVEFVGDNIWKFRTKFAFDVGTEEPRSVLQRIDAM